MSVRTRASVPKLTEDSSLSDLVQIYEISSPEEANALGDLGVVDERPTYGYRRVTALVNRLLAAVGKPTADHKRVFSPAASRRGDRIKVSRIAALLSALIVLTAAHRTQSQPAPDASWINLRASASHSSELVTTKEDLRLRYVEGRNFGVGKISLVAGSGEMSPEEFHKFYPPLLEWIRNTLDANAHVAQTVSSRGFSRLPHYFTKHTLVTTKVVIVDPLPVPPLASMGLIRKLLGSRATILAGLSGPRLVPVTCGFADGAWVELRNGSSFPISESAFPLHRFKRWHWEICG